MASELAEALTKALHITETQGGWWGHPECQEFGRLVAPVLLASDWFAEQIAAAKAEERKRIVERFREQHATQYHNEVCPCCRAARTALGLVPDG